MLDEAMRNLESYMAVQGGICSGTANGWRMAIGFADQRIYH
jgi:hypothetical protein